MLRPSHKNPHSKIIHKCITGISSHVSSSLERKERQRILTRMKSWLILSSPKPPHTDTLVRGDSRGATCPSHPAPWRHLHRTALVLLPHAWSAKWCPQLNTGHDVPFRLVRNLSHSLGTVLSQERENLVTVMIKQFACYQSRKRREQMLEMMEQEDCRHSVCTKSSANNSDVCSHAWIQ